jgi:hypothetical protein
VQRVITIVGILNGEDYDFKVCTAEYFKMYSMILIRIPTLLPVIKIQLFLG